MEFQKQDYDRWYQKINQKVAVAIFCILIGITILMLGAEYLTEQQMLIPIGIFALLLIAAFALVLKVGFASKAYRKKVAEMPDCYTEEEKQNSKKKWKKAYWITGGIAILGMLILVPVYLFLFTEKLSLLPIAILFFFLSLLFPQAAYWKLEAEKMDAVKYNKQGKEDRKKVIRFSIGMGITIALTILAGMIGKNWDISFGVFFLGSMLSIAITTIEKKNKGDGKDVKCSNPKGGSHTNPNS